MTRSRISALVLRQRAEDREQEFALGRGGVHALGQRAERDAAVSQLPDDGEEVGQRATETIEFPHHEGVALPELLETCPQPRAVVPRPLSAVLVQVALVDACGKQRVALQVVDWRSSADETLA